MAKQNTENKSLTILAACSATNAGSALYRYQLLAIFLFAFICSQSQSSYHLSTNAGLSITAMRDKSMSPLMYSGTGFSTALSLNKTTESKTLFHTLNFKNTFLKNRFDNKSTYLDASYKSLSFYHREKNKSGRIVFGWSNNNYFNYYHNPSFRNYGERSNYYTSFGFAALYTREFTFLGREFTFEMPLSTQLLGFYMRPSYVSSLSQGYLNPDNSGFKAWLHSIEVFLPHKAQSIDLSPQLRYSLKSGNYLALGYQYEFLRIKNPEKLSISAGAWQLAIITKL